LGARVSGDRLGLDGAGQDLEQGGGGCRLGALLTVARAFIQVKELHSSPLIHAAGSRFYACCAGESPSQISFFSHDSNFSLGDFDPRDEGRGDGRRTSAASLTKRQSFI
jgi:hypothetical protein